ncbi:TRAP transporter small permease subunit [Pseudomonas lopnurensis]|uniref:TRAP transporter small permease subunit n=1 Tax=Pseudomonas lopnurensis TaxID=1477517 RepID=UPI001879CD06|nr:TRAP transporter small permease subunit [Pseudomonas lopnurensis]MBE7374457.1 TRAP transporter small permease subunit [Pseudomonas lopnurensis]
MWVVINRLEQLVELLGSVARGCLLLLVLLVSTNVLVRYGFDVSPVALQELEWFLISPIAMLGISYVLKHRADVRVDFIYETFRARTRAAVDLFSALATCLLGAFLAWACWHYMMQSYRIGEGSPDPGGLPHRYLVKAFLPLGFALFALQGIADTLRALSGLLAVPRTSAEVPS